MQNRSLKKSIIESAISILEKGGFHTFDLNKVSKEMKINIRDIEVIFPDTNTLIQTALKQTLMVSFVENLEECTKDYRSNHEFLKRLFHTTLTGALRHPKITKSHFYTSFIFGREQPTTIKYLNVFINKTWAVIKSHIKTEKQNQSRRRLNQAFASLLFVALLPQVFSPVDPATWSEDLAFFVEAD